MLQFRGEGLIKCAKKCQHYFYLFIHVFTFDITPQYSKKN